MTTQTQVPAAPNTPAPVSNNQDDQDDWTASEYKAAWTEIHERHEVSTGTPSATGRRLGSRAAAVYDAIFRTLNVPDDIARLMMFLAAFAEGQREFSAYRAELANAYFDEADTEKADRERAQQSREQRFGRLMTAMDDWQRDHDCWLIQYFPGYKITAEASEKGKVILPLLDLFARVYTESRSTSAFQATRDAKLKRVTEAVITAEFRDIPPPGKKRKPRSMSRTARLEREQKIILSRMAKLMQELTDTEREKFTAELSEFIPLYTQEESDIKPAGSDEKLYKNFDSFIENKGLIENLGALVEGTDEGTQGGSQGVSPPPCVPETDAIQAIIDAGLYPDQVLFKNDLQRRVEREYATTPNDLERNIGSYLDSAADQGRSFIVRVRGHAIMVDDCDRKTLERLRPYSFMQVETSAENFQSWVAVSDTGGDLETLRRRFFEALKLEGLTGNGGSYGALRWPGSVNYKPGRNEFIVRLLHTSARRVSADELERAGLLADLPEPPPRSETTGNRPWPDYEMERAAIGDDRSRVDWHWSIKALDRGHSIEATIAELECLSDKAASRRDGYARKTVERAARVVGVTV